LRRARGREAAAFRGLSATGVAARRLRSCANEKGGVVRRPFSVLSVRF